MDGLARTRRGLWLTLAFVTYALAAPASSPAVDTLYWSDQGTNAIRYVPADGSAPAQTLYPTENAPDGIALDPSTGRIYWASEGANAIRTGFLSGAPPATDLYTGQTNLNGLAVDPVNNRIYWAIGDAVRGAPLAGGGTVDTVHAGEQQAQGVAADVAGNLVYWTQNFFEAGFVRRGPFGGGGATALYGGPAPNNEFGPSFVAVDSAANGVWWTTSCCTGGVRAGTPGGATATSVYPDELGEGIVADTAGGRLYWVESNDGPSEIHSAPIAGGGTVNTVVDSPNAGLARGLALLRTPLNTATPVVSPTSGPSGTVLSCTQGTWSIGVPGAFVYRAPTSFAYQWQRNGSDIAGATSASYTAPSPGTYTCRVTATNQAGSTPANSNEAIIADPADPAPPVVTLSPDEHDFGERPVDDDSPPQKTFTAENTGGTAANITSLALAGPEAVAFEVVSNECGATLGPGARCDVAVSFDPSTAGSKIAMLELESDGGNDSSALAGIGVAPPRPPAPAPNPPASLNLIVDDNVVLHRPIVPTRCRTGRRSVRMRRCRVHVSTLGGSALGTGTQNAGASKVKARRQINVRVRVNRRGRRLVAPALGGVPVKMRAVGRMTDGRRRHDRNRSRLFAERHHLVPPISGIFVADKPILLPAGRRFLRSIAARARRVDVVECHGHAARLPRQFVNPVFAASLAVERAFVACNYLRRHGMRAKFVKTGHSNTISRNPGSNRNNPAIWPPDRRSGIVLIRH